MKKKVAFITGISGMVGSHLAEYLIKNTNFNIVGMIRKRSSLKNIANLTKNINEVNLSMIDHGNSYLDIEQDTVSNYRGRWEPQDYE